MKYTCWCYMVHSIITFSRASINLRNMISWRTKRRYIITWVFLVFFAKFCVLNEVKLPDYFIIWLMPKFYICTLTLVRFIWKKNADDILDVCLEINSLKLQPDLSGASELNLCGRLTDINHYLNQCWNYVNWTLKTNFSEISIEVHTFLFNKMHFKMSSAKMAAILSRPQCVC